ncbi:SRPBCC family protein [Rubrolithibacter danxiaensis]|uniref:SRPBCC family protein n=1 Tax=Rubrolithibacter danxiaensis TaxID=3390805 RepID=UPI003BF8D84A
MENEPIVIERTFNAPVEKVWNALTDSQQMKQWYFDIADFKPEVGFEFRFYGGTEEKQYLHICKILAVVPKEKLAHTWRYDTYEGNSEVIFELFEGDSPDETKLKLTHEGLDTFPRDNPDFAKESFMEGWNYIIGSSLKSFVEN